jgi:hypothetical protein
MPPREMIKESDQCRAGKSCNVLTWWDRGALVVLACSVTCEMEKSVRHVQPSMGGEIGSLPWNGVGLTILGDDISVGAGQVCPEGRG